MFIRQFHFGSIKVQEVKRSVKILAQTFVNLWGVLIIPEVTECLAWVLLANHKVYVSSNGILLIINMFCQALFIIFFIDFFDFCVALLISGSSIFP